MLVTTEAVELQLDTAGLGSRILATIVDFMVVSMLFIGMLTVLGLVAADIDETAFVILVAIFAPLLFFGYPIVSETLWRGRTVGKSLMGLRVVTTQGAPIRLRQAAIRAFVGLFDFQLTFGTAAVVSVLATRDNRRLGDLAAGTLVIRTRRVVGRTAVPVSFHPHPGSEDYTRTLDVSLVDNDMHQAIRSFLLRAQDFSPEVRWGLAVKFATAAARRIKATPPAGMHPETFLVSVLSACAQSTPGDARQAFTPHPAPAWAGPAAPAPVSPEPAGSVWASGSPAPDTHLSSVETVSGQPRSPDGDFIAPA